MFLKTVTPLSGPLIDLYKERAARKLLIENDREDAGASVLVVGLLIWARSSKKRERKIETLQRGTNKPISISFKIETSIVAPGYEKFHREGDRPTKPADILTHVFPTTPEGLATLHHWREYKPRIEDITPDYEL